MIKNVKYPYLEQRISAVRRMLDHDSMKYMDKMSKEEAIEFKNYILEIMNILDFGGFKNEIEP